MKRRRASAQLTEEHYLIIALLLVILLAISMLYCLGLASLALRHAWETKALPWSATALPEGGTDTTPIPSLIETVPATLSP